MVGRVGISNCDSVLCPKGYYAEFGRQAFEDRPCQPCRVPMGAQYMGSTSCMIMSERDLLGKLYNNTAGSLWVNKTLWLTDSPICSWYGITCDDDEGDRSITMIDLSRNGLNGTFPIEIWQIPFLRVLKLNENPGLYMSFANLTEPSFNLDTLDISGTKTESLHGLSNARSLRNVSFTGLVGKYSNYLQLKEILKLILIFIHSIYRYFSS